MAPFPALTAVAAAGEGGLTANLRQDGAARAAGRSNRSRSSASATFIALSVIPVAGATRAVLSRGPLMFTPLLDDGEVRGVLDCRPSFM